MLLLLLRDSPLLLEPVSPAQPRKQEWRHGDTSFVRTVSNATPSEGDAITVKTVFSRKSVVEWLWTVSEYRPACLTYVDGSAKVSGKNVDLKTSGTDSSGAKFVQVKGNWPVYPLIDPTTQTFSFDYKVGADCARTVAMNTWMKCTGSLGDGNYGPGNIDKSIPVTVQKNTTTTTLGTVMSGVQVGQSVPLKATAPAGRWETPSSSTTVRRTSVAARWMLLASRQSTGHRRSREITI